MTLVDKHKKALAAAKHIYTWTKSHELAWLAEEASMRSSILEIGTYAGASAVVLAESTKGVVYCLDYCPDKGIPEQAQKNLAPYKQIRYFQADAGVSAAKLKRQNPDLRFDMIWIDDGHLYHEVVRDCLIALLFKTENALICGHDYERHPDGNPSNAVAHAVCDCFGKENVKIGAGSIWYL